ncbi:glycosyltransferase [Chenggangzhangella methanolivorans]|uniref:glycosyltransferase n=1 Tax=Chenggangzhangella methanolivorans TaxID=1437009 RepID=UPI0032046196
MTVFASTASDPRIGLEAICEETALTELGLEEASDVPFFKEHHAYLSLMSHLRRRSFDVIHNNSLHYLPVSMADTLSAPMVTTLHTPPFCWLESGVRLCAAPRSVFVGVSQSIRNAWSPVAKIDDVVTNGIDLARFAFRATPDVEPYLIWFGRIVPEKGLDLAIDAARSIGARLRIAGPILDADFYEQKIAPRLGSDIVYLGHLAHPELSRAVGGARALLCTPQWEEPYGLVVAEALACGVPVAAFARGAIPEILDLFSGVLATPDDVGSLAAAALEAQRLDRRACRRRAEAHCDAEAMIDGYELIYERLTRHAHPIRAAAKTAANLTARISAPVPV